MESYWDVWEPSVESDEDANIARHVAFERPRPGRRGGFRAGIRCGGPGEPALSGHPRWLSRHRPFDRVAHGPGRTPERARARDNGDSRSPDRQLAGQVEASTAPPRAAGGPGAFQRRGALPVTR